MLLPSGLVLVDDFAWAEVDPPTAEWFYGVVRLLQACQVLLDDPDSFAAKLLQHGGDFAYWAQSRAPGMHTVPEMWSALEGHFQPLSESAAPYLYRYLCAVVADDELGAAVVSQALDMERRLAQLGALTLIGRRFVGRMR